MARGEVVPPDRLSRRERCALAPQDEVVSISRARDAAGLYPLRRHFARRLAQFCPFALQAIVRQYGALPNAGFRCCGKEMAKNQETRERMRNEIRFLRRGRDVRLGTIDPMLTLLDYLRLDERALGTKEGCAEGDCGACTVVLRKRVGGRLVYQPVNACILLAGQADGADVITVDDLADGALHPVQQAMVEQHGSQCGFCTPGFVMALFALYHAPRQGAPTRQAVNDFIAGNLCRCTGYRPIVDAALAVCAGAPQDHFATDEPETARRLAAFDDAADILVGTETRFFASPASIAALAEL